MSEARNVCAIGTYDADNVGVLKYEAKYYLCLNLVLEPMKFYCIFSSGAFLTPRSGIRDG
jgi:hypothetical protein